MNMLSLSDNEFSVINFLVRNFAEKLTIRSIAQRLGFSPAGVFNILKKLEKEKIVVGQRLGTGLFYSINLEEKIAVHLASIVLLYSDENKPGKPDKINIEQIKEAKAAILDKKALLLITDSATAFNILDIAIQNVKVTSKTYEEVTALLRKKDAEMLHMLKQGTVLFGEEVIVGIIKKCVERF